MYSGHVLHSEQAVHTLQLVCKGNRGTSHFNTNMIKII